MRTHLTAPVNSLMFLLLWCALWMPSCNAAGGTVPQSVPGKNPAPTRDFGRLLGRGAEGREGGSALADARADALRKAKKILDEYFQELDPQLEWRPSFGDIKKLLFKGEPKEESDKTEMVDGKVVRCWSWTLAIEPQDWHYFLYQDRLVRAGGRMLLLARFLAGLVALFAVIAGYIRADDWTKGYYTGWLRAAAGAALALVATVLWWIPYSK
jgi:hypothetical protein